MWLGTRRGYLQDWLSQQWVKALGRKINPEKDSWAIGPTGDTREIDDLYLDRLMKEEGLIRKENEPGFGLMESIRDLKISDEDYSRLSPKVIDFYEKTTEYHFEIWSSWCGVFRPFGWLIRIIFSKRLKQLNLPMSPMDSSLGIESNIIKLIDPKTDQVKYTVWYRKLLSKNEVIYSGIYTHTYLPKIGAETMKVVFPLPNGNGSVIMSVSVLKDGSFKIESKGKKFGESGFYFYLTDGKTHWVKFVRTMHEYIHVYEAKDGFLRADHILNLFGLSFLKLHYKMTTKETA